MTFDPDFDLGETISAGFSAALETYEYKIMDLEVDCARLEEDLRQVQDELEAAQQENYDLQTEFDDYRRKTDQFADDLTAMARSLEDGLV